MVEISHATAQDLDWLVLQLKEFAASYDGTKKPLFGPEAYAREAILNLIANHVVLVARVDGAPAGLIAGIKNPHLFNPDLTLLSEILWWVPQEFRHRRVGAALLKEFILYGQRHDVDWIQVTLREPDAELPPIVGRQGFKPVDQNYLLEAK